MEIPRNDKPSQGTVFIQVWAKPGINPFDLHTRSDKLALWKITTTLSGDVVENNQFLASIPGIFLFLV